MGYASDAVQGVLGNPESELRVNVWVKSSLRSRRKTEKEANFCLSVHYIVQTFIAISLFSPPLPSPRPGNPTSIINVWLCGHRR